LTNRKVILYSLIAPTVDIFNADVQADAQYRKLKNEVDENTREVFDSAKKAIEELPDSVKKEIKKAIEQN
jgi:hypothetical protein